MVETGQPKCFGGHRGGGRLDIEPMVGSGPDHRGTAA